jgi:hypothetical protein
MLEPEHVAHLVLEELQSVGAGVEAGVATDSTRVARPGVHKGHHPASPARISPSSIACRRAKATTVARSPGTSASAARKIRQRNTLKRGRSRSKVHRRQ